MRDGFQVGEKLLRQDQVADRRRRGAAADRQQQRGREKFREFHRVLDSAPQSGCLGNTGILFRPGL
jgi:hypothetical protein